MNTNSNTSFRLPSEWAPFLMPLLLSIFMSALVSMVVTIQLNGISQFSLQNWINAWGASWIIAYPSLLVVLPMVKGIISTVTHSGSVKNNA